MEDGVKRKFPRIILKEQNCVIHDGQKYLATGTEEREVFAIVLDLSFGGALIKTNITSKKEASFTLHLPKIGDLESFAIKSIVVRITNAPDTKPLKPRYIWGLKFVSQEFKKIEKFLKLASTPPDFPS